MELLNTAAHDAEDTGLPYLLFAVGKNVYGISSEFVRAIETLGDVTSVVGSGTNIRGGIIYQNSFIYLLDMRKLFELDSQIEEFEKSVQPEQRIKDHENWMNALEKSVREHTEFTLTDDPHQCAFGRWYYAFKTDNNVLKHRLSKIEAPHEAIHNTAKLIKRLMQDNDYEAAQSAIEELRATHYRTTTHLLSSLHETVANCLKELFVVIESGSNLKGIIVDSIEGIEYLGDTLHTPDTLPQSKHVKFICQRKESKSIVIVLDRSIIEEDGIS